MDVTILATDRGSVPMNIGAIFQFNAQGGPSWATVVEALSARVPTIPRLRQRLRRVPIGCGRPRLGRRPGFQLDWHLIHRNGPHRVATGNSSTSQPIWCASDSTPTDHCGWPAC